MVSQHPCLRAPGETLSTKFAVTFATNDASKSTLRPSAFFSLHPVRDDGAPLRLEMQ